MAVLGTPWLMVRLFLSCASFTVALPALGVISVFWNAVAILLLHGLRIPITTLNLAACHLAVGLFLTAWLTGQRVRLFPSLEPGLGPAFLLSFFWSVLVFPYTHLAGVDTYKWQQLATRIAVEQRIPWMIHPLSLFGFTPESYPALHPLFLASIQILWDTGVDGGFYLVSLITGVTGFLAMRALAGRIFADPSLATWCAFFYMASPVFVRYNHWATGRGLFLAFFPLTLHRIVSVHTRTGFGGALMLSAVLPLAHKTGWVVLPVLILVHVLARWFRLRHPGSLLTLLGLSIVAGIRLTPSAFQMATVTSLAGWFRTCSVRFAWMLPFALLGTALFSRYTEKKAWRLCVWGLILSLPLAGGEMYGALVALPWITVTATAGFAGAARLLPRNRVILSIALLTLTLVPAVGIIVHRSRTATPRRIREAARFLDTHDPKGPLVVVAPEGTRVRQQFQAYLRGARPTRSFAVRPLKLRMRPLPPIRLPLHASIKEWIAYLRRPFEWKGLEDVLAAEVPRIYFVAVDGIGPNPPEPVPLYDREGIAIYGPRAPFTAEGTPARCISYPSSR